MHGYSLRNQAQAAITFKVGKERVTNSKNFCEGGYNHLDEDCVPLILRISMMSSPGSSFETSLISHMFYLLCVFLGKKSFLLFLICFKGKCPTPPHQWKTVQWYWIHRHSSLDSFNVYFYFMVLSNLQCYSSMQSRICSGFRCTLSEVRACRF